MNIIASILLSAALMGNSPIEKDTLNSTILQKNQPEIHGNYILTNNLSSFGFKILYSGTDNGKNIYKVVFEKGILFEINKSELDNSSKEILNKFTDFIVKNPTMIVDIIGHTDKSGPSELNQALSMNRAKSVESYLISNNVAINQINEVIGKSSSEPVKTNFTESGRASNRRVEVFLKSTTSFQHLRANHDDLIKTELENPLLKKLVDNVVKQVSKANETELEIDGLIVDDTKTKSGKDFYDIFYSLWIPPAKARNYSITISEKPYRMNNTLIEVSINENMVYQSVLQPRQDIVESQSNEAISYSQDYLQNYEEIMNMINGEDLSGSGIY